MDMPLIVRGSKQLDNHYPANLTGAANPDIEISKLLMILIEGTLTPVESIGFHLMTKIQVSGCRKEEEFHF